jgi:23S rRNA (guanosine2251-2'-O)-methyltransferase
LKTEKPEKKANNFNPFYAKPKTGDDNVEKKPAEEAYDGIVIYGRHPVVDAVKSGRQFEKILLLAGTRGELEIEIRHLCREYQVPLNVVPKEKLDKLTQRANHQGVVGLTSVIEYQSLEKLLPEILERGQVPLLLLLDGITDVRNFGAIARSAEVMGVQALVIPQKGGAPISADALKTSAGALSRLPICREKSLSGALDFLGNSGVRVLAGDLKAASKIYEVDFTLPTAIIIGAEDEGVNRNFLQRADETFLIPQVGATDSLNVSVATGIILYEALRQRLVK